MIGGLVIEFCVFVAGWRYALWSERHYIIIIIVIVLFLALVEGLAEWQLG